MNVRIVVLALLATLLVACGSGSVSGGPSAPGQTTRPVTTPEEAVAAVLAHEPRLTGIGPLDPELIGQASWYEVAPASGVGAFIVQVRVGWGDCPAGCIDEHTWTFAVQPDGTVVTQAETGPPVPPDAWPSPGGDGRTGLWIVATAGATCPVVQDPPDPACVDRPVAGATVVVLDVGGAEVAAVTTGADGSVLVELEPGGYVVEGQPVEGLMGTPAPVSATVIEGVATPVQLAYDTGIR